MDSSLRLMVQKHETAQVKHQQIDSLRLIPIFISLRLEAEATFSIVFENIAPKTKGESSDSPLKPKSCMSLYLTTPCQFESFYGQHTSLQ